MAEQMIVLLMYVLILLLIFGVVFYVIDQIPLPAPWGNIAKVIVGLILLLILLQLLLGNLGGLHLVR